MRLLLFFDPGTHFPWNEKNYAVPNKNVQKSSWNEPYSSSSSFTKQSCSKMADGIVPLNQNGESLK